MTIENPRNHQELTEAMKQVRLRIAEREQKLVEIWQQLPGESVRTVMGSFVPGLVRSGLVLTLFRLIKSFFGTRSSTESGTKSAGWAHSLLKLAFELGLGTLLGFFFRKSK